MKKCFTDQNMLKTVNTKSLTPSPNQAFLFFTACQCQVIIFTSRITCSSSVTFAGVYSTVYGFRGKWSDIAKAGSLSVDLAKKQTKKGLCANVCFYLDCVYFRGFLKAASLSGGEALISHLQEGRHEPPPPRCLRRQQCQRLISMHFNPNSCYNPCVRGQVCLRACLGGC